MKRINGLAFLFSAVAVLTFVATGIPDAASEPIKSVFVKDGQIFVRARVEAAGLQLTGDDSAKFLPVWSKDGVHIAFAEKIGKGLGRIVVIDERGRRLEEIDLGPGGGGGAMRYIEALEWVSPTRLAVSGSANPSLTETRFVDLDDSASTERIFDDGPGADFSPDGRHFAYTSGSPHFTSEESREPALNINFRRVFPEAGVRVRFLTERVWSPGSDALAVVAEDVTTGVVTFVTWRTNTGLEMQPLALPSDKIQGLFWSSGTGLVKTANGFVRPTEDGRIEIVKGSTVADEAKRGAELREALRGRLEEKSRTSADFWCETCALSALPRKVSLVE